MISNIVSKFIFRRTIVLYRCKIRMESNFCYTNELSFINKMYSPVIPTYRVLNNEYIQKSPTVQEIEMDTNLLVKMYTTMISLNIIDTMLYECQRQGRISFYMTNFGEEAVQIGSAAALLSDDIVYAQYRESGILLWRGLNFSDLINQCYGNCKDKNKGRQMPVHYGSKEYKFVTLSSPLTTQLPQAVGAAYGLKQMQKNLCIVCYFGEGAASEGDAHAALNFAATLICPVIFICRNNQYAISTPIQQQYGGDGIAARGPAYGINTIRVDGNDIIAMYNATKFAREYTIQEKKPVLIEAMTYRIGHHSTSDNSTMYRSNQEINSHKNKIPIVLFKKYLEQFNLWDMNKEENFINFNKKTVLEAITIAEKHKIPSWEDLFTDVYYKMPNHISHPVVEETGWLV
ncbi:PREDICTED: 2-oxoisovalerate dehydrogenase subunit alpha, mitochondrial [Ceratosolen solmsi marchali]|uniref:2-oxoisovalerate dehydrogenase subunit alpha n=1 Tax=Ceratosolen solmsi marchali TaxID=326594 RepID=A0AAJ6YEE2_9HYME|nr:PREDICTED: 2-oxoisovalerate dehydrogenase subunit alpha, mitochondrial [Ceratosolen solmsi marchali]